MGDKHANNNEEEEQVYENHDEDMKAYMTNIIEEYVTKTLKVEGQRGWLTLTLFDMKYYWTFETLFNSLLSELTAALKGNDQEMIALLIQINQMKQHRMGAHTEENPDVYDNPNYENHTYDELKDGAFQVYDVKSFLNELMKEFVQRQT